MTAPLPAPLRKCKALAIEFQFAPNTTISSSSRSEEGSRKHRREQQVLGHRPWILPDLGEVQGADGVNIKRWSAKTGSREATRRAGQLGARGSAYPARQLEELDNPTLSTAPEAAQGRCRGEEHRPRYISRIRIGRTERCRLGNEKWKMDYMPCG